MSSGHRTSPSPPKPGATRRAARRGLAAAALALAAPSCSDLDPEEQRLAVWQAAAELRADETGFLLTPTRPNHRFDTEGAASLEAAAEHLREDLASNGPGAVEALDDWVRVNRAGPVPLPPDPLPWSDEVVVDRGAFRSWSDVEEGAFRREHGVSSGPLALSLPGFARDGRTAFVYVESLWLLAGFGSGGSWVLLRLEDGRWRVARRFTAWVS